MDKAVIIEAIDAIIVALSAIKEQFEGTAAEPAKPAKPAARGKGKPAPAPEHTKEEITDQLKALVKAKDKQAAIDALARFGCKKLPDLRDDQIDEFHAYLEKTLEEGSDPGAAEDLFG